MDSKGWNVETIDDTEVPSRKSEPKQYTIKYFEEVSGYSLERHERIVQWRVCCCVNVGVTGCDKNLDQDRETLVLRNVVREHRRRERMLDKGKYAVSKGNRVEDFVK